MACIASVLLSSSLKMGVLDPRMILLSLRNRDLATVYQYFIKLNTWHIEFWEWQREMPKIGLCCNNSTPLWCDGVHWKSELIHINERQRETLRSFMIPQCFDDSPQTWQASVQVNWACCWIRLLHTTLLCSLSHCTWVRRAQSPCSCWWRIAAYHVKCSSCCSWAALAGWSM